MRAAFSFYRPHKRVTFNNELVNHVTGEVTFPVTRTKQEFKDQCDINNILKQFKLTGQIQHINKQASMGRFEDLPDEVDFQTSLNTIRDAERAFEALPSKVRERFGNEATKFLAFLADPENRDEAQRLGLLKKPEADPVSPPPPPTPPKDPVAPPSDPPQKP